MTTPPQAKGLHPKAPTSEEFTSTLGQVTWLMTLSKAHRDKPISLIEAHVAAPLMFKQVRVFTKGKQPLAAVIWAYASDEVRQKLQAGGYTMTLQDWRSGPEITVVDCISPLADAQVFIDEFMRQADAAKTK
ncbi:MAG: toxin-activating lysine-acyltransferase [Rhodobacter sp.]|nr:toxin-activating lysine-acyltransferase [Rhodobacter sp.]